MKKELLPIGIDLSGKVAVVTGAGGVPVSYTHLTLPTIHLV